MDLETILKEHFGCKRPMYKTPKKFYDRDSEMVRSRYLTNSGEKAYEKLVRLVYDLAELVEGIDANDIVETLDDIADGYDI